MSNWKLAAVGYWRNEEDGTCVVLDQDYRRTYIAYRNPFPPGFRDKAILNAAGDPVRFRSLTAAIKALDRKETK